MWLHYPNFMGNSNIGFKACELFYLPLRIFIFCSVENFAAVLYILVQQNSIAAKLFIFLVCIVINIL